MEDNTVEIYTNNDNNIYINQNKIDNFPTKKYILIKLELAR